MASRSYSTRLQGKIDRCLSAGLTITDTARMLGIDRATLTRRLSRRREGDEAWGELRQQLETPEVTERDDRTLKVYRMLRGDAGLTAKQIAERTGFGEEVVRSDLEYLSKGRLSKRIGWKWYSGYVEEAG